MDEEDEIAQQMAEEEDIGSVQKQLHTRIDYQTISQLVNQSC